MHTKDIFCRTLWSMCFCCQLLTIRISRWFLECFFFIFRVTWSEGISLSPEWMFEWIIFTGGGGAMKNIYHPPTPTDTPAEHWSPTYQPSVSECWCNCTCICRKRSNKVRTEFRLPINLILNHGTCWSVSQQQEYTLKRSPVCKQTSALPTKPPADMSWTCRDQAETRHLGLQTTAPGPHVARWTI